jgi:hypothetical protein
MDVLRHGAADVLSGGVRAPSTLGSHLRSYNWGNVSQLERAGLCFLAALCRQAPLLPGADVLAFIDVDSTQKRVYGYAKQGARFGYTKVAGKQVAARGLNVLAATICTPLSAPVIAAARACGCTGLVIVRADSAYYTGEMIAAVRRAGARFSVTVPMNSKVTAAISAIPEDAWTPIRYPRALWDDQLGRRVSDAEVAETEYTAFEHDKDKAVTARLIVRRVRDQNKAPEGQGELFPAWRHHAVFTDSPHETLPAEAEHRDHAIVEQAFADVCSGPLAHLPSGKFTANAAWLSIAAMAHNLLRAAGALAGRRHARARTATVRADLVTVPARTARTGRGHLTLHLPEAWHREREWLNLWEAACGPPPAAA